MDLLQLKYFVEIARLRGVTKAANELHVSQPSLSQTIRRLEEDLGFKLFEKDGRKLKLTTQGQRFYQHISIALQEIEKATDERKKAQIQGHITLGSYLSLYPILPSLKEFSNQYPDIKFTILRISDLTYINSKNMDALLCYEQSDGLNFSERLYITSAERMIILPIESAPETENFKFRLQDISEQTFVSLQWDHDKIEEIFDEFAHNNMIPNIRYYTNSSLFKQEIMETGLAAGFTNSILVEQFHNSGHYAKATYLTRVEPIKIQMAWRATDVCSGAAGVFKQFMYDKFSRSEQN